MSVQQAEQEMVDQLRNITDRLDGDRWVIEEDDGGKHLVSMRSTGDGAIIATFHPDALRWEIELVGKALDLVRIFISVGDRAGRKIAKLKQQLGIQSEKERKGDYTTQASILISDRVFWRFLETKGAGGPVRDATAADTRLKSLLKFKSKKELNTDERAKSAWLSLWRDFGNWKGQGQGQR
ncbi:hypothetical protein RMS29_028395 (plasmid) [Agrobacterium rosae]|uniref:Uncharacterized protein n=1 Tax=Agrobacterium rosae TaxID=1972867 RepID=A0ABU4W508_9HYPH|nr:hypothetical protein [Agrobacterium rosae]MDX8332858.1 hypothetical protein [Agrobacterium rosae]